jgi:hypothetical protein
MESILSEMSQTVFVSDQLASIQEGTLNVPWKGTMVDVPYITTSRNNVYVLVRDVIMIVAEIKDKCTASNAMCREISKIKYTIGNDLRAAIEKVFV